MSVSVYKNPDAPVAERVVDLLSKMTLDEKIAQLNTFPSGEDVLDPEKYPLEGIGGINLDFMSPDKINIIQKNAKERSRLGIPPIIFGESLHGLLLDNCTVFPQAIGLGSSFNEELIYNIAKVIGKEAQISGVRQTLAPDLDTARDPRWGRVEETYGEDCYLTSRLALNYVKGLQSNRVAATMKHFAAHGSPENGINIASVHVGEREWRESMIEPFATVCKEGHIMSAMPAYSELDGIPLHASHKMLTDVLRGELGFDGYVISDFCAVAMIQYTHRVALNALECGKLAINAGVDMEAPSSYGYGKDFKAAVENGLIPQEQIDTAVKRILSVKFKLGLFENPYAEIERASEIHTSESIALSRSAAHETVVLLKNENGILPLKNFTGHIAVIGPNADTPQNGDYSTSQSNEYTVTLKAALENELGSDKVIYKKGCNIASGNDSNIAEAAEAAKMSDIAIVVLGDNSSYYGGIGWGDDSGNKAVTCGEGFDSASLELPPVQKKLLDAIAQTGVPVILVLETGRPYCIGHEYELSKAVIEAWYAGEQGGNALCDIICGKVSPSGKLPISFPRTVGHIPCFYNYKVSSRGYYRNPGTPDKPGRDYVFDNPSPLFPFGFGMSYTKFEYTDLTATVTGNKQANVSVIVKNAGSMSAKESVLMFISAAYCPVTPFVKRLRKFTKIYLEPGESKTVSFELSEEDFGYIGEDMKMHAGEGKFKIAIDSLKAEIEV